MIKIKLNNHKYRYEVYQMANQFFNFAEIEFGEEQCDYSIELTDDFIVCSSVTDSVSYKLEHDVPVKEQIKKGVFRYFSNITGKILPWGILVGIRPSKIALNYLNMGKSESEIVELFKELYYASDDKAKLCIEIAKVEKQIVNKEKDSVSIYIGMPFCPTRCMYCSFTSNPISSTKNLVEPYITSLMHEIENMAKFIDNKKLKIECVYFGGGTPTSVDSDSFERLMNSIYNSFIKDRIVKEFTVECGRPDSIDYDKLLTMKNYKVSRISINPQSMNDATLKSIGRSHNVEDVIQKYKMARELGFDNINMDIIVGLQGENLESIKNTCRQIRKLEPDSITVHGLCVKRGSRFHESIINNAELAILSQDEINAMYDETVKLAKSLGMEPYYMYRQKNMVGNMENVGYAKQNKLGIYNVQMIEEKQSIIAFGADAVSKVVFLDENRIERFANVKDVREYISRIDEMILKKINLFETLY